MTNEQITETLATEVMGWAKGTIYWELDRKPTDYRVCEELRDQRFIFDLVFVPLNNHNHMAAVRKEGGE